MTWQEWVESITPNPEEYINELAEYLGESNVL